MRLWTEFIVYALCGIYKEKVPELEFLELFLSH